MAETVGVVMAQRIDRPVDRSRRGASPWWRQVVALGPRPAATRRFRTSPDPLEPAHQYRPTEARRVVENLDPATVPDRDHAALRASGQCLVGLDIAHQQAILASAHLKDVQALDTEEFISPRTPRGRKRAGTVSHRQGPSSQLLGRC